MSDVVATPGVDRVIFFKVNGYEFGFRRPSRADEANAIRRFALKTAPATGREAESVTIESIDGENLMWEARLEIGLLPRRSRAGVEINLAEKAPSHWLDDGEISFAGVMPDEFAAVCEHLEAALKKKEPEPKPPALK